ncbi:haloacid dehalogenase type II [Agarivorans sp. B2Z047]|uniref:haloacid dehalogenase type II n=1 Tax=Agarivorans sp. B2Z047 TaxID=2652721 RepID=UPI00128DC2B4|nr:haloacid dehalogenase type II [Agarivorans sp. B2Z047]MPW28093.1 haloacid dehalogenase type II [Agarivorans sp. B2Z047]UQN44077.1 haloacid dehalogenase type II [Agarivorans sp. B2Z047]
MATTLAFDVYGTLIDTQGVLNKLREYMGEQAAPFSQAWRDKQLEYSFRRGLMQNYQNFALCTTQALDYCCQVFRVPLTEQQKQSLLAIYKVLPAHPDAKQALAGLQQAGFRLYAFSNGQQAAVELLLETAEIRPFFSAVVSVDEVKSFKPDPAVYQHFLNKTQSQAKNTWLVSSNPFDVTGAVSVGWQAAWVQRSPTVVFDPWELAPTVTITSLLDLAEALPG